MNQALPISKVFSNILLLHDIVLKVTKAFILDYPVSTTKIKGRSARMAAWWSSLNNWLSARLEGEEGDLSGLPDFVLVMRSVVETWSQRMEGILGEYLSAPLLSRDADLLISSDLEADGTGSQSIEAPKYPRRCQVDRRHPDQRAVS